MRSDKQNRREERMRELCAQALAAEDHEEAQRIVSKVRKVLLEYIEAKAA